MVAGFMARLGDLLLRYDLSASPVVLYDPTRRVADAIEAIIGAVYLETNNLTVVRSLMARLCIYKAGIALLPEIAARSYHRNIKGITTLDEFVRVFGPKDA